MVVTKKIAIEELLERFPSSVQFLIHKGLPCLVCGEPTWGTLEDLARRKGWNDDAIAALIREMNEVLKEDVTR